MDGDVVRHLVEAGTTEVLGPGDPKEAEFAHPRDVLPGEFLGAIEFTGNRRNMRRREVANHFANLVVMGFEV
jgi:hypothetical protein